MSGFGPVAVLLALILSGCNSTNDPLPTVAAQNTGGLNLDAACALTTNPYADPQAREMAAHALRPMHADVFGHRQREFRRGDLRRNAAG
jgi:hypothetical protein